MNLQQLYYFRTIAELEHFTKAADQLMVTQPSLSHSINDLEAELNVHLFDRQGRNVKLTKYGKIFLEYVTEALDVLDEGKNKLNDFINPDSGTISLTYFSSLEEFVPYLVTRFYAETERMQIKFQFYQAPNVSIAQGLLAGTADLALVTALESEKLVSHKIGEHNMVLIVPHEHPLAACDSIDLRQLKEERFITYDYQCKIREHIDQIFELTGIAPQIVTETTHDTLIYSSVAANFGLALVPEPLGMPHYNVKALRIENELPPHSIYLVWRDVRYMSPAVKKFRDFIIKNGLILDEYRRTLRQGT